MKTSVAGDSRQPIRKARLAWIGTTVQQPYVLALQAFRKAVSIRGMKS